MKNDTKRKNVLVVGMGTYVFGRERRAVRMLKRMQHIYPYFLISKYEDGSVSMMLRENGFEYKHVPFGYLGRSKLIWTLITLVQMPGLYLKFFSAYFRKKCESILILSIHPLANALLPILLLKYLSNADIVLYLGDIPANNCIYRILARCINRLTARVIVISRAVKQGLSDIGFDGQNIRVVYNGIDLDQFERASSSDFRLAYGWAPKMVLVGYAGQFLPNKGVWDFVRASELVLKKNENCRFPMFGKIDFQNHYQLEILRYINSIGLEDYIVFTGLVDEMEKIYASLDIVVMPSRHQEPLGNVGIEAMASGVPLVATRVGGIPEIVIDGETGFLVEKANPEHIAERILLLVKDVELREKMGLAGRERAREMFDIEKNACKVEEVLLGE